MPNIIKLTSTLCKECQIGKQTRIRFKTKEYSSTRPLELIHTNLCRPTKRNILQGERYFMLLIDDFSRMKCATFLKEKSEALSRFKIFKSMVENEMNIRIKCLRSERGGEFTPNEFGEFYEEHVIKRHLSTTRTPQKNGVVERKNRIVQEMERTMSSESKSLDVYWKEVVHTALYILNRGQLRMNNTKNPYELWYGRPTIVKYFRIFGSK